MYFQCPYGSYSLTSASILTSAARLSSDTLRSLLDSLQPKIRSLARPEVSLPFCLILSASSAPSGRSW